MDILTHVTKCLQFSFVGVNISLRLEIYKNVHTFNVTSRGEKMNQRYPAANQTLARPKFDGKAISDNFKCSATQTETSDQKLITYLTTDELSARIKYDSRTIRERLKDSVLLEGIHYIRPFGGRKILYMWEKVEKDMAQTTTRGFMIPLASGGVCNG
jgi:hypothetical protein